MKTVMKWRDYNHNYKVAENFIEKFLNPTVNESLMDNKIVKDILQKLSKDLKFNYGLIFTFGTGIAFMYPIVLGLIKNSKLHVDLTPQNIVLLTLTVLCICYLEEGKTGGECTESDVAVMEEELERRGIGMQIVQKIKDCFLSIGNLLKKLFHHSDVVITNLLDMFAYTALLIPTSNAITWLVNHNGFSLEDLPGNLMAVGFAIMTFLSKYGFNYLVDKIKRDFGRRYSRDTQSDSE